MEIIVHEQPIAGERFPVPTLTIAGKTYRLPLNTAHYLGTALAERARLIVHVGPAKEREPETFECENAE